MVARRKLSHRRRMGLDRTIHALAASLRPAPNGGTAKDFGGHLLHAGDGMPVAANPEGIRAVHHRAGVFLPLLSRRHVRSHQSRPGHAGAGNGWTTVFAYSRRDRQPVGQDHRSRRAARVRCQKEDQGSQAPHRRNLPATFVGTPVAEAYFNQDNQNFWSRQASWVGRLLMSSGRSGGSAPRGNFSAKIGACRRVPAGR